MKYQQISITLLAIILVISNPSYADKKNNSAPEDFISLRNQRAQLNAEKDAIQDELTKLNNSPLPSMENLNSFLTGTLNQLNNLQSNLKNTSTNNAVKLSEIKNQIQWQEQNQKNLEEQVKKRTEIDLRIPQLLKELSQKRVELSSIETKIDDILRRDVVVQEFKQTVSLFFAILVGVVIFGFFKVASIDEKVRRTIFSGQAGIQFLTLFSLVIAIILFGITDVLGDKELSALLGGLSGYILGRSSNQDQPDDSNQITKTKPLPEKEKE